MFMCINFTSVCFFSFWQGIRTTCCISINPHRTDGQGIAMICGKGEKRKGRTCIGLLVRGNAIKNDALEWKCATVTVYVTNDG